MNVENLRRNCAEEEDYVWEKADTVPMPRVLGTVFYLGRVKLEADPNNK